MVPHDYLGTLPQQVTAISATGGFVWALLRFGLGWRKQTLDSDEQIRTLLATEVAAIRAERIADKEGSSRVEKHLREMAAISDRRHAECEDSRQEMRREVDNLHSEIRGLHRQISESSADMLLILERGKPSEVAPHSAAAAKRIKENGEGGK